MLRHHHRSSGKVDGTSGIKRRISEKRVDSAAALHDGPPTAVDALLEEYLHEVNKKDHRIHQLLQKLERCKAEREGLECVEAAKVACLEAKVNEKRELVKALRKRSGDDATRITQLSCSVDQLRFELDGSRKAYGQLREELTSIHKQLTAEVADSAAQNREASHTSSCVQELKNESCELRTRLEESQRLLKDSHARCRHLEEEVSTGKAELKKVESAARDSAAALSSRCVSLEAERNAAASEAAAVRQLLGEEKRRLCDDLQRQLELARREAERSVGEVQKELSAKASLVTQLEQSLHQTAAIHTREVQQLNDLLARKGEEVEMSHAEQTKVEAGLKECQQKMSDATHKIGILETSCVEWKAKSEESARCHQEFRQRLLQDCKEREGEREGELSKLKAELQLITAERDRLQAGLDEERAREKQQLSQHLQEVNDWQQKCKLLTERIELTEQLSLQKVGLLEEHVSRMERESTAVQRRAAEVEELAAATMQGLTAVKAAAAVSTQDSVAPPHRQPVAEEKGITAPHDSALMQHLHDEVSRLQQRCSSNDRIVSELQCKLSLQDAERKTEADQHANTIHCWKSRVEELQNALDAKAEKVKGLKKGLREALEQLAESEGRVREAEDREKDGEAEVAAIRERYSKERAKMDRLVRLYEEQATQATEGEKTSRKREASLLSELEVHRMAARGASHLSPTAAAPYPQYGGEEWSRVQGSTHHPTAASPSPSLVSSRSYDALLATWVKTVFTQKAFLAETLENTLWGRWGYGASFQASGRLLQRTVTDRNQLMEMVERLPREKVEPSTSFEASISSLQRHVDSAQAEVRERREEVLRLMAAHAAEKEQLLREAHEKESLHQSSRHLHAEKEVLTEQIAALRRSLAAEEEKSSSYRREAEERLKATAMEAQGLRNVADDMSIEKRHYEEMIRDLQGEATTAQQNCKSVESQLRRERAQLKKTTALYDAERKEVEAIQRQFQTLTLQLENEKDALQQQTIRAHDSQGRVEQKLGQLEQQLSDAAAEKRRLESTIQQLQRQVAALTRDVEEARSTAAAVSEQLDVKSSEASSMRERCANMESLKKIAEIHLYESEQRVKELNDQVEEVKYSHHILQVCFDKQQEQIQAGRLRKE